MNGYLLDTNVVSELMKPQRNPAVIAWLSAEGATPTFVSALTMGELFRGLQRLRQRDVSRAERLRQWIEGLEHNFGDRILPVDHVVARAWGELPVARTLPVVDALLAATARVHRLTVVTRNVRDFADLDVALVNPFEPAD